MRFFFFLVSAILISILSSCMKGESVDLIIHNARVNTMNDQNNLEEAIAIKDGIIIEVGAERQILNKYSAAEYIDAEFRDVYPGFIDAHGHIMSYARQKISVDLVGCRSYDEMLVRIEKYQSKHNRNFIIGRGWDQSLWKDDEMPNNKKLNALFPDIPVCLFRIDGHALLANNYLINKSNVVQKVAKDQELSSGGYFMFDDAEMTGVMVDNAMNPILEILPKFPKKELIASILDVQEELLSYGITGVHEAGINNDELELLMELVNKKKLSINIYGMLLPTEKNIEFAKNEGIYKNNNLLVRSFKVYGDGALGSRGACLKKEYSDKHEHIGYLTSSLTKMNRIAKMCKELGYQMNTHAIGDSTNKVMLQLYKDAYMDNPDHRWRIEHAQIVDPNDYTLFADYGVFPSVQPTHAVSDQRWAESRIGSNRMNGAYAYKSLLDQFGMIALGTDFPVELTNPFLTIQAAVNRKNSENFPDNGFLPEEKLNLEQCLKGMTIWASFAAFQENEIGSIEAGKDATIVIFESPVTANEKFKQNFAHTSLIKGKKVYSIE